MFLYITLLTCLLWLYYTFFKRRPMDTIPGPPGIPIFGNLFDLDLKKPHLKLNQWAKQYGDLYKLNLLGTPRLIVTGYSQLHDVLVKKGSDFGGRPYSYIADIMSEGFSDIVRTDMGPELRSRRKFVHSFMKQHSSGLKKIEQVSESAIMELINEIGESEGKAIDIMDMLDTTLNNIICIMLNGERIAQSDVVAFRKHVSELSPMFAAGGPGSYLEMFPWLRYFGNSAYKGLVKFVEYKNTFFQPWIEEASTKPSEGFISRLMSLPEHEKEECGVNDTVIKSMAAVLIMAGSTTSLSTLSFLINLLVSHLDIQRKLQTEVSEVVGKRSITFKDKQNMPYHQSVLLETARLASVAPFAIPHKTTKMTSINNIVIPKDTQVWCNLWGLHHDERLWEDPFKFNPERFLDEHGKVVPADHPNRVHLLPFGAGTRVCVGEVFAQSRMFLILAMIMQHFTVLPETDIDNQPSWDPREMTLGSVHQPNPFKVIMRTNK